MDPAEMEKVVVPKKNITFLMRKIDELAFEERPVPNKSDIRPDEVIVCPRSIAFIHVEANVKILTQLGTGIISNLDKTSANYKYSTLSPGICGSDVHFWKAGRIADFVVDKPMVLGHETSGIVFAVGSEVEELKPGDRVCVEPGETCRKCSPCKAGRYNLCKKMKFAATPPTDGTLCGYYVLPSDLCYKLPDNVSMEEGSMLEPLAVAVHALVKVADLHSNKNVAIFGAGPVGLLCMAVAKALGSRRVIGIDIVQEKLNFARRYAATDIWRASSFKEGENAADYARRQAHEISSKLGVDLGSGPNALDLVVDCTGSEACIATGIHLVRDGGTYVQVGIRAMNASIPVQSVTTRELQIKGSWRYGPGVYKLALDLVAQKQVALKPLISHRYKFKDSLAAFLCMADGKGPDGVAPIKCIIAGPEEDDTAE